MSQEVLHAMKEWRHQHPKATFQEMETALDEHLARLRAQMLQDMALTSPSAHLPRMSEAQGTQTRTLVTEHDQPIELSRSYATCPQCGAGLFPPG